MHRPANILLTATDPPVPVLVDFGFAEKYDPRSSKAYLSNLAYGTPEVWSEFTCLAMFNSVR